MHEQPEDGVFVQWLNASDILLQKRSINVYRFGLVCGDKRHFQQYFNFIVAVSFIGGGNQCI